ncbi:FAD-dependent oxidoreductase [Bradyrhizobium sp. PMVTL-01]|uniref:FAD-dependent oxidoreductase n=1 Tax=Bradyrhizobium sp. PMVTL-01 TaxID=3434999 RepID=UPI003F728FBD
MKIGVVGAGIIGSSIAYHLGKAGAQVTVFDIGKPGNGVSSASFACLNAFGQAKADLPFRLDAIKYHSMIAREVGSERHLHTDWNAAARFLWECCCTTGTECQGPLQVRKSGGTHFTGRSRSPRAIYQD